MPLSIITDQFKTLKRADLGGKVYRLLTEEPVPVYDLPLLSAPVMRRLQPGSLLVGFSDPGEMRQINTANQDFGYIKRSVTLLPVEGLNPEGLYDPERRAVVESALPSLEEMAAAYATQQTRAKRKQYCFMIALFLVILLGVLIVLTWSPPVPAK